MEDRHCDGNQPVPRVRGGTAPGRPGDRPGGRRRRRPARSRQRRGPSAAERGARFGGPAATGRPGRARDRRHGGRGGDPRRNPRCGGRRRVRDWIRPPRLRLRGQRAGLAAVHDLPLPLRPRLVEHPGRLHGVLGDRRSATGSASRSRAWHWSRRTSRWPVGTPTTSSCSPSSTTSSRTGTSTRRTASTSAGCWPRADWSWSAARTTSRTPT